MGTRAVGPRRGKYPCRCLFQTPIVKDTMFPTCILTGSKRVSGSPEWLFGEFTKRCRAPKHHSKGQPMSARPGSVAIKSHRLHGGQTHDSKHDSSARPWPPNPTPFPRRDKSRTTTETRRMESSRMRLHPGGPRREAWQARVSQIRIPVPAKGNGCPRRRSHGCSKLGTNLRSPAQPQASCDDTHPLSFPFPPPVPVDRSASAVLRYGCWPALLSVLRLRDLSLCVAL